MMAVPRPSSTEPIITKTLLNTEFNPFNSIPKFLMKRNCKRKLIATQIMLVSNETRTFFKANFLLMNVSYWKI